MGTVAGEFDLHELAVEDARRRTSARRSRTTARTAGSSCCAPRPPTTSARRSSSARSTSSSAPTTSSPSATARRPTSATPAAAWRSVPSCCARPPASCGRCSTRSSTTTSRWWGAGERHRRGRGGGLRPPARPDRARLLPAPRGRAFFRAVHPLLAPLELVEHGGFPVGDALHPYFRDVADHVRRVTRSCWSTRAAHRRARGEHRGHRPAPERGGPQGLRLGGDRHRADADRHRLRDELRAHARAELAARLPRSRCAHGQRRRTTLWRFLQGVGWLSGACRVDEDVARVVEDDDAAVRQPLRGRPVAGSRRWWAGRPSSSSPATAADAAGREARRARQAARR